MRKNTRGRAVALHGSLLGAGALVTALLGTIKFSGIDWQTESAGDALLFNETFCATLVIASLGWCLFSILRPRSTGGSPAPWERDTVQQALGSVASIAGALILGVQCATASLPSIATALAGASFGSGMLVLGLGWFTAYRAFEPAPILVHAALSFSLAGIVRYALICIDSAAVSIACAIVMIVLAFFAFRFAARVADEQALRPYDAGEDNASSEARQVKQTFETLWLPLVGAMIAGFIQGLVWNPIASETQVLWPLSVRTLSLAIGPILAACVVFIIVRNGQGAKGLRTLQQVAYPIAMAVLLLYPVVGPSEGVLSDALELLPQACFSLVVVITWAASIVSASDFRRQAFIVFTVCTACLAASYLTGLLLIHVIGTGGRDLCLVLLTAYLVLLSISLAQNTQTEKRGRISDEMRPELLIRKRCDELSEEFGVSPRETEVLYYLGRGYNHGYIARKLFVSENTVRTHVRHIYSKLGISSREELLDLIDAPDRPTDGRLVSA